MSPRTLKISALLWWAFWTLIVIPGHTRGYIPLAPNSPCCRSCCSNSPQHAPANAPNKTPAPDPCNCAICHLTAVLTTPPAPILFTINLTPTSFSPPHILKHLTSSTTPRTILCRGPPTLA